MAKIHKMRYFYVVAPLLALLAVSLWYAVMAWRRIDEPIPSYGLLAITGGVFFSLLIGGGLMALAFYSSRHGYDNLGQSGSDDL